MPRRVLAPRLLTKFRSEVFRSIVCNGGKPKFFHMILMGKVEAFQLLSPAGNELNFVFMFPSNLDSFALEMLERT